MKRTICTFLVFLFSASVFFAQEANDKQHDKYLFLKVNLGLSGFWEGIVYEDSLNYTQTGNWNIGPVSPGFGWSGAGGNVNYIELTKIRFGRTRDYQAFASPTPYSIVREHEFELRYEYQFHFLKNSSSPVKPYIGPHLGYNFLSIKNLPEVSTSFPNSYLYQSLFLGGTVGVMWNANERLFLDLRIPVSFASIYYERNRMENPNFPPRHQKTHHVGFESPVKNMFFVQVGAGLKVFK